MQRSGQEKIDRSAGDGGFGIPVFASLFLLTVIYLFFNGYGYLVGADRMLIYKVMCLRDPHLFANDPVVLMGNASFLTLLAWPLAFLNRWIPFEWLFFLGHFVCTFFYLHATFTVGRTLFKDDRAAFLAVLALFVIKPVLVDASLYPIMFYHRNVAWVLQIYAIDLFLRRRLLGASILLGLAFDVTPYSGLHLAFMMLFALCFMKRTFSLRLLLASLVSFLLIIFPMLAWRFMSPAGVSMLSASSEWLGFLRQYAAGYVFPSAFCADAGRVSTVLMALIWPLFLCAGFLRGYVPWEGPHRIIGLFSISILVLFGAGTVFTEGWPVPAVIQFMLFRSQKFLVFFAILYFSYFLARRFQEERMIARLLLLVFTVAAFLCSKMILGTALAAFDFLLLFWPRKASSQSLAVIPVLLGITVIAVTPVSVQPHLISRLFHLDADFLVLSFFTGVFLWFVFKRGPQKKGGDGARWACFVLFAGVFMLTFFPSYWNISSRFFKNPFKTLGDQIQWPWRSYLSSDYGSLFEWVRKKTPADAVFLIPPRIDSDLSNHFRIATGRSEVLLYEDSFGLASLDYARYVVRLEKDFRHLLVDLETLRSEPVSAAQLLGFRQSYPFDFFLTLREMPPLDLPIAFQNERFQVYETGSGVGALKSIPEDVQ